MKKQKVIIVGAGFTGLTAAYVLSKNGFKVQVLESDKSPGGLAGTFDFGDGVLVEKFYHHWFISDSYVPELVKELGLEGDIIFNSTKTGMYYNGQIWKLSTPFDLLRFTALSFFDRIKLGLLVFKVRRVKDWKTIEHLSIREWLEPLCGEQVYKVVWEPLVKAKFSIFSELVTAVWMWKKLVLRGSTRNDKGAEQLAYFKGGFGRLAEKMVKEICNNGGQVSFGECVKKVETSGQKITKLITKKKIIKGDKFLFTTSLPIIAEVFRDQKKFEWLSSLKRIKYLGNICLVLRLQHSLSNTYWLNVNDPGFPFVGVIEHTNFDDSENYKGSHIVYLSRYIAVEDKVWRYSDEQYFKFAMEHLKKMFPKVNDTWVIDFKVWRSKYAQPIAEKNYSTYIPVRETPFSNLLISTMAQIYPEDRGTNYAIREGRSVAEQIKNN